MTALALPDDKSASPFASPLGLHNGHGHPPVTGVYSSLTVHGGGIAGRSHAMADGLEMTHGLPIIGLGSALRRPDA